jgi:hypothetical protein
MLKTFLLSILLLALTEVVVKPLVIKLTKRGLKLYAKPAFNKLDSLLLLPDNWQKFVDNSQEFILEAVLPEDISKDIAKEVTLYMLDNFDLQTFLKKTVVR